MTQRGQAFGASDRRNEHPRRLNAAEQNGRGARLRGERGWAHGRSEIWSDGSSRTSAAGERRNESIVTEGEI